ncbi:unnamed protein product [marine sediment metagenome]|uniref:Uncharacterized protein n=1 Tax=marine sediment metagenome TaxID=412755 RepID=X0SB11_9ZZZZ
METKGVKISGKDIGIVIALLTMIVTFFVKFEVMKEQVNDNSLELEQHNLELIEHQIKEISTKVNDIDGKVDDIYQMAQEYFITN